MSDYDFTTLSPREFEQLACDLLSAEWGGPLEIFKPGPDGGVDLRHTRRKPGQPAFIVQCKRYAPHKYHELKRAVLQELPNLARLKPEAYVLVTSTALSDRNKEELRQILAPHLITPADIFGPDELNALIRRHPNVHYSHFKLWVSGTDVLRWVLHARIFHQTAVTMDALRARISRFVMHAGFARAREMLEKHHHCVIAGNPGIGKSTVARVLMCEYVKKEGYKPICVTGNIEEAWSVIAHSSASDEKVVVLYDDFLGSVRFDEQKLDKNEDISLMSFIELAARSDNIRFLLTTREYILADADRIHGNFSAHAHLLKQCTISLKDYTRSARSLVLFNHLYFSDLSEERLALLVQTRVYRDIVANEHFNPRVVETITQRANSAAMSDTDFIARIRSSVEDPSEIWGHPFRYEIGPVARQILMLLWSFGRPAALHILRQGVQALSAGAAEPDSDRNFTDAVKSLEGNFTLTDQFPRAGTEDGRVTMMSFSNPSVEEYVERVVSRETSWSNALVAHITHFAQVERLQAWAARKRAHDERPVILSETFWRQLHERAAAVERCEAGRIFTYRPGEQCYTVYDMQNDIDRTLIRLKIALRSRIDDTRTDELRRRVASIQGWQETLLPIASAGSIVFGVRRLTSWLPECEPWLLDSAQSKTAFGKALSYILAHHPEWTMDLACLHEFHKSMEDLNLALSMRDVEGLARIARYGANLLSSHTDQRVINAEIAALIKLLDRKHLRLGKSARRIRKKTPHLMSSGTESRNPGAGTIADCTDAGQEIDLDALFQSLLDR